MTSPAATPTADTPRSLHLVVPAGIADPAAPSGGNRYDVAVADQLASDGWAVTTRLAPGAWPYPTAADLAAADAALSAVPRSTGILLDGIVACAAPDIIEAHARHRPLAVLVHLPLADETGLDPATAARLDAGERRTLAAAAVVVATSRSTAARLAHRHGLDPAALHVAVPGTHRAPATIPNDAGTRLLCVASLTPRKGHDLLVEALSRVRDLPWTCSAAGPTGPTPRDRSHADAVRREARRLGLDDRLRWLGPRSPAEIAHLHAAADLLVVPSRAEPYGMVVTEALACAVPVVAAEVDGLPEALGRAPDGELPGLLVQPGDAAALARALRAWLTDDVLRRRLRQAAAERRPTLATWADTAAALAHALSSPPSAPASLLR